MVYRLVNKHEPSPTSFCAKLELVAVEEQVRDPAEEQDGQLPRRPARCFGATRQPAEPLSGRDFPLGAAVLPAAPAGQPLTVRTPWARTASGRGGGGAFCQEPGARGGGAAVPVRTASGGPLCRPPTDPGSWRLPEQGVRAAGTPGPRRPGCSATPVTSAERPAGPAA